ncbi:MAG: hypothetical protein ACFCVE_13240, partial [Phycisphaerae bacterium]
MATSGRAGSGSTSTLPAGSVGFIGGLTPAEVRETFEPRDPRSFRRFESGTTPFARRVVWPA